MTKLFCDLKTDEEKSAFFLSGRGYETGVIAHSIQNDVAMAYHRCAEYRKEMDALQAECERLRKDAERLDWLADQQAQVQIMTIGNKTRYRIGWPDDAEYWYDWHSTAREAIDAAMEQQA